MLFLKILLVLLMFCATVFSIDYITKRQQWAACFAIAIVAVSYNAFCLYALLRVL